MRMLKAVFVAALPAAGVNYADRRYYGDENCLTVTIKVKQERSRDGCHTGDSYTQMAAAPIYNRYPFRTR